jgi:hypothetical protein
MGNVNVLMEMFVLRHVSVQLIVMENRAVVIQVMFMTQQREPVLVITRPTILLVDLIIHVVSMAVVAVLVTVHSAFQPL